MKRQWLICSVTALALFGGGPTLSAADKADRVRIVGSRGLKIEGKIEEGDTKFKFVPTPFKANDAELPGKMFLVKLGEGKKYKITMDSTDLDSVVVLKDDAGKQLGWDDDSGGGLNSLLNFENKGKEGTFKIYALSLKGAGNFTLKIVETGAGAKEEMQVYTLGKDGLKIEGKIDAGDGKVSFMPVEGKEFQLPGKLFLVKLPANKKFTVSMDSNDLDSVLVVKDEAGKQLAWDDDSGGGLNSLLTFETKKEGTYKIYALSLKGTGDFTLQVKEATRDASIRVPSSPQRVFVAIRARE
jgi:hypothetical protein